MRELTKLKEKAPQLIEASSIVEKILRSHDMVDHEAHVALCLDVSGTMQSLFHSGQIQSFAERVMALSSQFDENATIDVFLFGETACYAGEMNLENFQDFINGARKKFISAGGTYYSKAIKRVREHYFSADDSKEKKEVIKADRPVYVMFVSDGTTVDEEETVKQLIHSSYEPIFWQFMAIGKGEDDAQKNIFGWFEKFFLKDFSFLKKLDSMEKRKVDNVGFFNVQNPNKADDQELFDKMLEEYPLWYKEAISEKMLS